MIQFDEIPNLVIGAPGKEDQRTKELKYSKWRGLASGILSLKGGEIPISLGEHTLLLSPGVVHGNLVT